MAQQQHPPFPAEPKLGCGAENIFALVALEKDAAASRISALCTGANKRSKWKKTPHTNSLFLAEFALIEAANQNFKKARDFGQLLFCWHGTKATAQTRVSKGGAA